MEPQTILAFCTLLLIAVTQTEAKRYRKDYVYDSSTDAFYKLHVETDAKVQRKQVCELEGAELMSPMSEQEFTRARAAINQYQRLNEEDEDWQRHDAADYQTILDYSENQNVLEMRCRVTTREGSVTTSSVYRNKPTFICKVKAKDVSYNSQCRVYVKGYQYVPSVGSCYKIPRVAYYWHQAVAECQAEGAYLAIINSAQEARELQSILSSVTSVPGTYDNNYFHIGFRATTETPPRVFRTIFNETLEAAGFNEWARNEPNNGLKHDEHCGSIYRTEGKLNDINCHTTNYFICEKEIHH